MNSTCATVLMVAAFGLGAAQPVLALADLTGTIEIGPGEIVPPGTLARVVLTIVNNGPDMAPDVGVGTYYLATVGHRSIEIFPTPETAPCVVRYTDFTLPPPGISTVAVDVRPFADLAAGASLTCIVGMITYPEAAEVIRQRFTFGFLEGDPVPDNNFVFVDIRTRAAATAVPGWSSSAALLLVIGVALTGLLRLRRRMLTLSTAAPDRRQKTESGERRAESGERGTKGQGDDRATQRRPEPGTSRCQ